MGNPRRTLLATAGQVAVADLRDFAAMQRASAEVVSRLGRLDIVCADAGINVGVDTLDACARREHGRVGLYDQGG